MAAKHPVAVGAMEAPRRAALDVSRDVPQSGKASQVLAAAREVFVEQGYGAASMDAIARAANVSKATLYAYFPGKEALFAAMIGAECQRNVQAHVSPDAEPRDARADLLRFARKFAEFALSPSTLTLYRIVVAEAPRFPELGRIFYESGPNTGLSRLADYLKAATDRGLLAVPEPRLAAEQLVGMIRGGAYLRRLLDIESEDDRELAHVAEAAVEVFLRAYAPANG